MYNIILDLSFDMNILRKKTQHMMDIPKLRWSPIWIRLENQYIIFPIYRLIGVEVDIDGVKSVAGFEVIEIVDDIDPYLDFLCVDWAFYNQVIINSKRMQMISESSDVQVISSLGPSEGDRYVDHVQEKLDAEKLDNIYNITTQRDDYVNPTVDGILSWGNIGSCALDSKEGLENWQN